MIQQIPKCPTNARTNRVPRARYMLEMTFRQRKKNRPSGIPMGYLQAEPIKYKNLKQNIWTYNSILLATRASKRFSSRLFQRASGFRVSLIPPRNFSVPRKARNTSEYRITDRKEAMNIYPKLNFMSNITLQEEKICRTGRRCKKNWVLRYTDRTPQVNPAAPYTCP